VAEASILGALCDIASSEPNRPALIAGSRCLDFGTLVEWTERRGSWLRCPAVSTASPICLSLTDPIETCVWALAILCNDGVVGVLRPSATPSAAYGALISDRPAVAIETRHFDTRICVVDGARGYDTYLYRHEKKENS
jgi:hypothetical protein